MKVSFAVCRNYIIGKISPDKIILNKFLPFNTFYCGKQLQQNYVYSFYFWPQILHENNKSPCHGTKNIKRQNMKDSNCWIIDRGSNEKIEKVFGAKLVAKEKSLTVATSPGTLK